MKWKWLMVFSKGMQIGGEAEVQCDFVMILREISDKKLKICSKDYRFINIERAVLTKIINIESK